MPPNQNRGRRVLLASEQNRTSKQNQTAQSQQNRPRQVNQVARQNLPAEQNQTSLGSQRPPIPEYDENGPPIPDFTQFLRHPNQLPHQVLVPIYGNPLRSSTPLSSREPNPIEWIPMTDREVRVMMGIDVKKEEYEHLDRKEKEAYFESAFRRVQEMRWAVGANVVHAAQAFGRQSWEPRENREDSPPVSPKTVPADVTETDEDEEK